MANSPYRNRRTRRRRPAIRRTSIECCHPVGSREPGNATGTLRGLSTEACPGCDVAVAVSYWWWGPPGRCPTLPMGDSGARRWKSILLPLAMMPLRGKLPAPWADHAPVHANLLYLSAPRPNAKQTGCPPIQFRPAGGRSRSCSSDEPHAAYSVPPLSRSTPKRACEKCSASVTPAVWGR